MLISYGKSMIGYVTNEELEVAKKLRAHINLK